MKTLLPLFLCCFLMLSYNVSAQYSLGIRTGYLNSWEKYGDVFLPEDAQTHVNGFHIAALGYLQLNKTFSVGIEPGYAEKGAACYPGSFYFLFDTKFQLNYVEMPLMIAARFPLFSGKLELSGSAGYGASYLVSATRGSRPFGSDDQFETEKEDITDSSILNRWDHGVYTGIGLGYPLGNGSIMLEGKYYHALTDAFSISTSKNRSIYVGLGYLIKV